MQMWYSNTLLMNHCDNFKREMNMKEFNSTVSHKWDRTTLFPGSLILPPPWVSEERPWLGMVMCYFDNCEHQEGVLCNQALCPFELCCAATAILPAMFDSNLRAKILNSIYSNIYFETIYRGHDVVAVVPIGFMESR